MTKAWLQAADKVPDIDGNTFPDGDITPDKVKGWSYEESLLRKREMSCLLKSVIRIANQEPNFHKNKLHLEIHHADHT